MTTGAKAKAMAKARATRWGTHWPPRCVGDVRAQGDAAWEWAADRRDVVDVRVALGAVPPNARPALGVSFVLLGCDGQRYRVVEWFECARAGTADTGAWVRGVLTRRVRAFNRELKAGAVRPAGGVRLAEGGAP